MTFLPKKDERAKHILKVLRLKTGDSFRAGLINGPALTCTITGMTDEGIAFTYEKGEDLSALHPLTLLLAEVRPICMKRILREVVSLGIGRLMLVISDLGEKSYQESSLYTTDEWKEIMKDGAMQAGFTGIPETTFYKSVDEAVKDLREDDLLLLDNVIGAGKLSEAELGGSAVMAVGPVRGWSARSVKAGKIIR